LQLQKPILSVNQYGRRPFENEITNYLYLDRFVLYNYLQVTEDKKLNPFALLFSF
jgi:hypothetical protein